MGNDRGTPAAPHCRRVTATGATSLIAITWDECARSSRNLRAIESPYAPLLLNTVPSQRKRLRRVCPRCGRMLLGARIRGPGQIVQTSIPKSETQGEDPKFACVFDRRCATRALLSKPARTRQSLQCVKVNRSAIHLHAHHTTCRGPIALAGAPDCNIFR